jgi:NAD(P)-dependent dehydrogenase (short-subunit alcohol dehydrogenase family)
MTDSTEKDLIPLVIVTGASGRLGSLTMEGFLDAGYDVVGLDQAASNDGEAPILAIDATDETSVADAFNTIVGEHGIPTVVIHTVGMWAMKPFAETSLSDWSTMMDVNLTSAFLVFREAVRVMSDGEEGPFGTLIGISSKQGSVRGAAQQAAYSASKAGVKRLVEAVAQEYAGTDLTAHAIAPSTILFDGDEGDGVAVEDLVSHCLYLASESGPSLNGDTLHAFG